jgi:hypothetical protein
MQAKQEAEKKNIDFWIHCKLTKDQPTSQKYKILESPAKSLRELRQCSTKRAAIYIYIRQNGPL